MSDVEGYAEDWFSRWVWVMVVYYMLVNPVLMIYLVYKVWGMG